MPVYRVFHSEFCPHLSLQVHPTGVGEVSLQVHDNRTDHPYCVDLLADDIPALIAELRRAAKLAKAAKLAEEADNGAG
jgi:hypothetical protein